LPPGDMLLDMPNRGAGVGYDHHDYERDVQRLAYRQELREP
jgi:hypothetical protein